MLMIVLGGAFDAVAFSEPRRQLLAWSMLLGSLLFPLGVILRILDHGPLARGLAIAGSALVTGPLAGIALGFARSGTKMIL
ncbi:MAG TPA: hypothetical protein VIX14_11170 [Terriglobales bacterium]